MIPEHVLSAWLCFYYHQWSQDGYDGWPINVPGGVLSEFIARGLVEPIDGRWTSTDGAWTVRPSEAGKRKAFCDAGDWWINPIPEQVS